MRNPRGNPVFATQGRPTSDFDAVLNAQRSRIGKLEIDLSAARSLAAAPLTAFIDHNIVGNSFYIDQSADSGIATVYFTDAENPGETSFTVQGGFILRAPFKGIVIENSAQAGKFLRIRYGVDVDFYPGISQIAQILNTVNIAEQGSAYGASYQSNAGIAAGGTSQVFSAAANVNGAIVWNTTFVTSAAAASSLALLAKATAPATVVDGDLIAATICAAGVISPVVNLPRPIRIAAGKGLFFFSSQLETIAQRGLQYTLL